MIGLSNLVNKNCRTENNKPLNFPTDCRTHLAPRPTPSVSLFRIHVLLKACHRSWEIKDKYAGNRGCTRQDHHQLQSHRIWRGLLQTYWSMISRARMLLCVPSRVGFIYSWKNTTQDNLNKVDPTEYTSTTNHMIRWACQIGDTESSSPQVVMYTVSCSQDWYTRSLMWRFNVAIDGRMENLWKQEAPPSSELVTPGQ